MEGHIIVCNRNWSRIERCHYASEEVKKRMRSVQPYSIDYIGSCRYLAGGAIE